MGKTFNGSLRRPGILGRKIGMSQIFDENGNMIPVTIVEASPSVVTFKKEQGKDGYDALQLGYGNKREVLFTKPELEHQKKSGNLLFRFLKEFRGFDQTTYNVGDQVSMEIFEENEKINVVGLSKGKGFAGVHKRHGFGGGRKTHGSHFHRAPGSIGACAFPSKVFKGMRMPGHKGVDRVTVVALQIIKMNKEKNYLLIKGAVPGKNNDLVAIIKR